MTCSKEMEEGDGVRGGGGGYRVMGQGAGHWSLYQ